jgi:hypothetical protein
MQGFLMSKVCAAGRLGPAVMLENAVGRCKWADSTSTTAAVLLLLLLLLLLIIIIIIIIIMSGLLC